jgi:hypothetical protein
MLLGLGVKLRSAPEIVEDLELEELRWSAGTGTFLTGAAAMCRVARDCHVHTGDTTLSWIYWHSVHSTVLATFHYVPPTTSGQL